MDADLLVLGTGTAGQRAAELCRRAGWQVAMVESSFPGGTCSQFGCDAKKPLTGAAAAVRALKEAVFTYPNVSNLLKGVL